jgi:hypothetical protein
VGPPPGGGKAEYPAIGFIAFAVFFYAIWELGFLWGVLLFFGVIVAWRIGPRIYFRRLRERIDASRR